MLNMCDVHVWLMMDSLKNKDQNRSRRTRDVIFLFNAFLFFVKTWHDAHNATPLPAAGSGIPTSYAGGG